MTETATVPFVFDRRRELRVKIKSLAVEAKIIRVEELRVRAALTRVAGRPEAVASLASAFASLRGHRVGDVRRESRYALLAYAILRGRALERVEPVGKSLTRAPIAADKLARLVSRFGPLGVSATEWDRRVAEWAKR